MQEIQPLGTGAVEQQNVSAGVRFRESSTVRSLFASPASSHIWGHSCSELARWLDFEGREILEFALLALSNGAVLVSGAGASGSARNRDT